MTTILCGIPEIVVDVDVGHVLSTDGRKGVVTPVGLMI